MSQPVTLRHKVSHSVTIVTPAVCHQPIQISSCVHGPTRNRQRGMTSAVAAVAPDISTNATRTETSFEKAASSVSVIDDAGTVRRISGDQNKYALRDEVSSRIPYRKVGHLLRFDFEEIVEWTKDKEK